MKKRLGSSSLYNYSHFHPTNKKYYCVILHFDLSSYRWCRYYWRWREFWSWICRAKQRRNRPREERLQNFIEWAWAYGPREETLQHFMEWAWAYSVSLQAEVFHAVDNGLITLLSLSVSPLSLLSLFCLCLCFSVSPSVSLCLSLILVQLLTLFIMPFFSIVRLNRLGDYRLLFSGSNHSWLTALSLWFFWSHPFSLSATLLWLTPGFGPCSPYIHFVYLISIRGPGSTGCLCIVPFITLRPSNTIAYDCGLEIDA